MSFPDYKQKPADHRSCLVLVTPIGSFISRKDFDAVFNTLRSRETVAITSEGKTLHMKFVSNYPTENNEWGDFQYHRKVLGLLCILKCNENVDGASIEQFYSDMKNLYSSTLLDSRLIILGTCNSVLMGDLTESTRKHVMAYQTIEDACKLIHVDVEYMLQSMFYVLEGKRLSASDSHQKQPSLLSAPFEAVSSDPESKINKHKFVARARKQIGDLCLMVDQTNMAVLHYQASIEQLRSNSDDLWLGGALEGLAVASSIMLRQMSMSANSNSFKRAASPTGKTSPTLILEPPVQSSHSFNSLDSVPKLKSLATADDIFMYYSNAITMYSKFPAAAIIEVEACLKATRFLIEHKKTKMAAEFLHKVAYVSMDQYTNAEKIQRYDTMGDLYNEIQFYRKASFFKRVAAMHCVTPSLPNPDWKECYNLLLQTFPGFKMSFHNKDGNISGWPGICLRVFHELIYASRQLALNRVIIRLTSLFLHTMHKEMTAKEVIELKILLESYTKEQADDGSPLAATHDLILQPVAFASFPLLSGFEVKKLPRHLEPHRLTKTPPSFSVFIYSPLNINRKLSRSASKIEHDFSWVEGNPGTVDVYLYNPLPLELRISDFSLIVEGVDFQSYPSSHSLPSESNDLHVINIVGTPLNSGMLKITGYQLTLFGVCSRCFFSELPGMKQKEFIVDVAPVLPCIQLSSDLPKSPYLITGGDNDLVTSAILQVYIGEQKEFKITVKNSSKISVNKITMEITSEKHKDLISEILSLDLSSVKACLPLAAGAEASVTIRTVGSLKILDLPQNALLSPNRDIYAKLSSALIESVLSVKYSGEEADRHNYYRECQMALSVVLIPSVDIVSYDITMKDSSTCQVAYEVINQSNLALDIENGDRSVSLKPMQSDRILCTITKCPSFSSLEHCRKLIDNTIKLAWFSHDRTKHGIISTNKLHWTDDQLSMLKKRSLVVNGCTRNALTVFPVGDPIDLDFSVKNLSGTDYNDVEISLIVTQQSMATEQVLLHHGSSYLIIGSPTSFVKQFFNGEEKPFSVTLVIFYSGGFQLECQCLHKGRPIHDIGSKLEIFTE